MLTKVLRGPGRHHPADDAELPAASGLDQKIVLGEAIAADFAEQYLQGGGADERGLGEHLAEVGFPEREAPERGQCSLLTQQLLDGMVGTAG